MEPLPPVNSSTLQHWEQVLELAASGQGLQPAERVVHSSSAKRRQRGGHAQMHWPKPSYNSLTPRADATGSGGGGQQQQQQQQSGHGLRVVYPSGVIKTVSANIGSASEVSDAWQEVAHASEAENVALRAEVAQLKEERAQSEAETAKLRRKLESAEESTEAWWEANATADAARAVELRAALEKVEKRADKATKLLSGKADAALRDVSSLRAQQMLDRVHRTTLDRELALLDGTVGFLVARLAAVHGELAASLAAQEADRQRADEAQLQASAAVLQAAHIETVASAQRRTIGELREHVSGAQTWAREAETTFSETLASIRYAAAEQLVVQSKRLRVWEEALERSRQQRLGEDDVGGGSGASGGRGLGGRGGGGRGSPSSPPPRRSSPLRSSSSSSSPPRPPSSPPHERWKEEVEPTLAQLVEEERALLHSQRQLFTSANEAAAVSEAKMLRARLADVEGDLESRLTLERNFADELSRHAALRSQAELDGLGSELAAARRRLDAQEEQIAKLNDWMAVQVASHRKGFSEAVRELADAAAAMVPEDAAALTTAIGEDAAVIGERQGAGTEGGAASAAAHEGKRPLSGVSLRAVGLEAELKRGGREGGWGPVGPVGLEAKLAQRLAAAEAQAAHENDALRRSKAEAERWARQLEERLDQATAALEIERGEGARLEAELATLTARLSEAEAEAGASGGRASSAHGRGRGGGAARTPSSPQEGGAAGGAEGSPQGSAAARRAASIAAQFSTPASAPAANGGGGSGGSGGSVLSWGTGKAAKSKGTGSAADKPLPRRIARARSTVATPVLAPAEDASEEGLAPAGAEAAPPPAQLLVGGTARPEDRMLRAIPTLPPQVSTGPPSSRGASVSFGRSPASPRASSPAAGNIHQHHHHKVSRGSPKQRTKPKAAFV